MPPLCIVWILQLAICGFCSLHSLGLAASIVWVLQLALCGFCSLHCVDFAACIVWDLQLVAEQDDKQCYTLAHSIDSNSSAQWPRSITRPAVPAPFPHILTVAYLPHPSMLCKACRGSAAAVHIHTCSRGPHCNFTTYLSSLLAV